MPKLCALCCAIRLRPPALAVDRSDSFADCIPPNTSLANSPQIFVHSSSFEELQQSGSRGCSMCALFARDISTGSSWGYFDYRHKIYFTWYQTSIEREAESMGSLKWTPFETVNTTPSCPSQWSRFEVGMNGAWVWKTAEDLRNAPVQGKAILSYVPCRELPLFNSHATFQTIKDWINACWQHHSPTKCPRHQDEILPTRVIDVSSSQGSDVSLHVSTNMRGTYVALSHVWGGEISYRLKISLLEGWTQRIDINKLPKSFQDAITVTRKLGLKYLWIDALCIVQDSPKDWQRESSRMGTVFKNAFLTIAISVTAQTHEGFLKRSTDRSSFMVETLSTTGQSCGFERLTREVSPEGEIDTRGWCLQENTLSTRILTFTPDECFFECRREYVVSESGVYNFHDSRYARAGGGLMGTLSKVVKELQQPQIADELNQTRLRQYVAEHWYAMIGDPNKPTRYSVRHLTYSSDRLPALSGLAHEVQRVIQCKYLAGIWECHLLAGLLWQTNQVVRKRQDSRTKGNSVPPGHGDPQAPSWSWAASEYPVMYSYPGTQTTINGISILDTGIIADGTDPMGRVSSGWITLNGPVLEMRCVWERPTPLSIWADGSLFLIHHNLEDVTRPEQLDQVDDATLAGLISEHCTAHPSFDDGNCVISIVTCLAFCTPIQMRQVQGLMLRGTGRDGQYRRVGYWSTDFWSSNSKEGATFQPVWDKFTRQTITLI